MSSRSVARLVAGALSAAIVAASPTGAGVARADGVTSTLTLSAPASGAREAAVTISGTLSYAGETVSSAQTLQASKQDLAGTHALPDITTSTSGDFSFSDTPTVGGPNVYTVSFAGDATHAATTQQVTVEISRTSTEISVALNARTYRYRGRATVTAHLGVTHDGRRVCIDAQMSGYATTTVTCATVNDAGNLVATYTMSRRTVFTARFDGDEWYAPASASRTAYSQVSIRSSLYRSYRRSGQYRLYHRKVNPVIGVTVAPNRRGACVSYVAQFNYRSAWRNLTTSPCAPVDSRSQAGATLSGVNMVGARFRLQAVFHGDSVNAATTGPWLYLKFTK